MSRDKPSHIPLFVDSYLADTTHLTTEQHGAYLLLLMAAWREHDCGLPSDETRLAAKAGVTLPRWRKIAPAIMEMWTYEGGRWKQKRLLKEWTYVREKRVKRTAAANARWSSSEDANALQMESKCNAPKGEGGGVGVGYSQTGNSEVGEQSHTHAREARPGLTVIGGGK